MAMVVRQDQNQRSSYPAPSNGMKMVNPSGKSSSCLKPVTASNVENTNPNPMVPVSLKRKLATIESLYDTPQAQSSVMQRAKQIEASLDPKFPSLLKVMMPSQVSGGFSLSILKNFCCQHLPKEDTMMVLKDEAEKEFKAKFLVGKCALSGGWRGFAIAHKLLMGDIVIFHLITPSKFKVYVVRSKPLDELDCGLGLVKLYSCIKQMDTGDIVPRGREECGNMEAIPDDKAIVCYTESGPTSTQSENDPEDVGFEFLDGLRLSESVVPFKKVKCMKDFNVVVNGLIINAEFSIYVLTKYYELCSSQNSFLHEHLLEGLNCKLIGGVISETINIADAIRACKFTTLDGNFSTWDRTLKAFEDLGMNVGFLRARLGKLANIASKSKTSKEAGLEKDMEKPLEVRDGTNGLNSEIETLSTCSEQLEVLFQEVSKAPW